MVAHCSPEVIQQGSFWMVFFLAGLTGSVTHCLGMCGPMLTCSAMCKAKACATKDKSLWQRLALPYHIGRMSVYGILGFLAALLSKQLSALPYWQWIAAAMIVIAAIMFLVGAFSRCHHLLFATSNKLTYLRGMLLGFLPCGLLYAALLMAAATANPFKAMVALWVFALGTMPVLLTASLGAEVLTQKWQSLMPKVGRVLMMCNGLSLLVMASNLVR